MLDDTSVVLSPQAREFESLMAGITSPPSPLDIKRAMSERLHRAASEPEGVTYRDVTANGVPAIWVRPQQSDDRYVLLHSHAGGGVTTSATVDRKLVGHIASAIGVPALVVDFRLAPESKYPAQLEDVESAFEWLVSQGYAPGNIIMLGHSIGGYIAIAVTQRRRDAGRLLPGAIVAVSPWADVELVNETVDSNAATDKLLTRPTLEFFREAWIGGTGIAANDPQVDLKSSDLSGLPPTLVSWGTYELFQGQDEVLAQSLAEAGVVTHSFAVPGGQHSFIWGAGRVPESDAAIEKIAAWVQSTLPIQPPA